MAGLLTNLFRLIGPTLPAGYCPTSYQELSDAVIGGTQVTFLIDTGNFLFNYGTSTPAPENRIFPWLNTSNGFWYTFQYGLWISPYPFAPSGDLRVLWVGTNDGLGLWSYDGGDGVDPSITPPTLFTGTFWQVDSAFEGRVPIGPGAIPTSSPAATVAVGATVDSNGNSGVYDVTLTELQGAVGNHTHAYGIYGSGDADLGNFIAGAPVPVSAYTAGNVAGTGAGSTVGETTASLFTLPANNGAGVTPDPINTMPPFYGAYFIKRTARTLRTLPA